MPQTLEFFFDYGSPFSYLANHRLKDLTQRTGVEIRYRPMLLGGVFKATGNQSPMMEPIEAKRAYGGLTLRRSAEAYGADFRANPHFPINTLMLMRSTVAAQRHGAFDTFHRVVFPGMWAEGLDLGDEAVLAKLLDSAGIDSSKIAELRGRDDVKAELRSNTDEAVERGVFGAPTLFLGDEMFFGADHFYFIERALGRNET